MTDTIQGVGLGLRRQLLDQILESETSADFFEIAPENWLNVGGKWGKALEDIAQIKPIICHGLSLSIGGTDPLDLDFIRNLKPFFDRLKMSIYSEHLSYCAKNGQLYELLPLPFTEEAIKHISERIKIVQDILERPVAFENSSYYSIPEQTLPEDIFIRSLVEESGCELLLDINNVYVNSTNHQYDAKAFIESLASLPVRYFHVAGHFVENDGFIVDTHGAAVSNPVWSLLSFAYETFGALPTLLERDFNIPTLSEIEKELGIIRELQRNTQ